MCLGTFLRLRRSLATSTLYAAVRIPAERFLCNRNEAFYYTKKLTLLRHNIVEVISSVSSLGFPRENFIPYAV